MRTAATAEMPSSTAEDRAMLLDVEDVVVVEVVVDGVVLEVVDEVDEVDDVVAAEVTAKVTASPV